MEFNIEKTKLRDLFIITREIFKDDRGFFTGTYRTDKFVSFGLNAVLCRTIIPNHLKG
jgi:dTDP-4-dehydrorhamnose 3,5-epimerase-like enzyme